MGSSLLFRCLTLIISSSPKYSRPWLFRGIELSYMPTLSGFWSSMSRIRSECHLYWRPVCRTGGWHPFLSIFQIYAFSRSEVCVVVHHQFQRHKLSSVRCHGHSHAASNESGKRKPALWWALLAPSSDGASAPHQGSSQASVVENSIAPSRNEHDVQEIGKNGVHLAFLGPTQPAVPAKTPQLLLVLTVLPHLRRYRPLLQEHQLLRLRPLPNPLCHGNWELRHCPSSDWGWKNVFSFSPLPRRFCLEIFANDLSKVQQGNQLLLFSLRLLAICEAHHIPYGLENPYSSYAWHMPPMVQFIQRFSPTFVLLCYCHFEKIGRNPQPFFTIFGMVHLYNAVLVQIDVALALCGHMFRCQALQTMVSSGLCWRSLTRELWQQVASLVAQAIWVWVWVDLLNVLGISK